MKKLAPFAHLAVIAAACSALPALAATPVTLTFEGATSFQSVADFYNGGTDGAGASGTNYGLSFSGSALALKNDELGPYFAGAPSPETVMFSAGDSAAVLNSNAGLLGNVTFFYASQTGVTGNINVYSGLNGTGTLLASIVIGNAQIGCTDVSICRFDFTTAKFDGVAHSIDFGSNSAIAFDDITVNVSAVPEPASAALLFAGLGAVGWIARRRRA